MKEKPIIFSTPMVQAILNTKPGIWPAEAIDPQGPFKSQTRRIPRNRGGIISKGDILWVRESWRVSHVGKAGSQEWAYIVYKSGKGKSIDISGTTESVYYASKAKWHPSIHLPRKAARLFLEVKSVRRERLLDISENDAKAEGVKRKYEGCFAHKKGLSGPCPENCPEGCTCLNHKELFLDLWNSIYAKRGYSWTANPWVWVIEFMRIKDGGEL